MKTVFSFIIASLLAVTAFAGTIRVSFNGNRDFQVVVDGRTYSSSDYLSNDIVLNNLSGDHTVSIYKINKRGRNKALYSSTVNVGYNEEIHLTVNSDGSIERTETTANEAYGSHSPMTDASFSTVYRKVNSQRGQAAKLSVARDAFNNTGYYFSTQQVSQIIGLINAEANRLELAKLSYDNVTDPDNFSDIYSLLRSQASRNELDDFVRQNSTDAYGDYHVALSDANFNQLYQNLLNQRNTSQRMTVATNILNTASYYFNVSQVKQVVAAVNSESYRLQLLKSSLDNIVDRENISQLFDLLSLQSSRDELDNYIRVNGYADNNYSYNTTVAMSDDAFNTLYQNIRSQWLPLGKYSAATDAFENSSNYFTTAQAKQIIALVSSESNRIQLAKLSFDNIVDRQNFRQLYDLLSKQSSKDELDAYIRTNYNYQF